MDNFRLVFRYPIILTTTFMRLLSVTLLLLVFLYGCKTDNKPKAAEVGKNPAPIEIGQVVHYGQKISEDSAISGKELRDKMGNATEFPAKVKGEIVDVCQTEGCWLNLDMGDGTSMKVDFNDHAFFVPKNIKGRTVIAEGKAVMDSVDVATLKEDAKDANKPQAEIDAITSPRMELTFEAKGIIVK